MGGGYGDPATKRSVGPALDPGTVKDIGGKAGETEKSVQFQLEVLYQSEFLESCPVVSLSIVATAL